MLSRTRVLGVVAAVAGSVAIGALLLIAAGTTAWTAAWVVSALLAVCNVAAALVVPKRILAERLRGPLRSGQAPADVVFVSVFGVVLLAWFVVMALDAVRFDWSSPPVAVQLAGAAVLVVASSLGTWVLRANEFASASVRIDDAHVVATAGPYAVVRHPMYSSVLLYAPGLSLALGSIVGALATPVILLALAVRITIEERLLRRELAGYDEYATQVRWRLVPGVW